jgi:hypothetical protein
MREGAGHSLTLALTGINEVVCLSLSPGLESPPSESESSS